MHRILIALGSNHQQAVHILWASQRLAVLMHDIQLSPTLWTEDIHGRGDCYMNRLVAGFTALSAEELQRQLKAIEAETGRIRKADNSSRPGNTTGNDSGESKVRVTIDLDLMLYDDQRYHLKDWPRPYIQQLILHIAL